MDTSLQALYSFESARFCCVLPKATDEPNIALVRDTRNDSYVAIAWENLDRSREVAAAAG